MRKRVAIVVVVTLLLALALVLSRLRTEPLVVSGFVEADEIRLGSLVGGRVARVRAEEGDRVRGGDVLVELEPFDLLERRAEAAAVLAARRAELEALRAGFREEEIAQYRSRKEQLAAELAKLEHGPRPQEIAAARAELELAEAEHELAALEQARTESLFGKDTTSRQELDQANSRLRVSQAAVQVKTEQLELLREGTREEDLAEARARLEEARQAWQLRVNGQRQEDVDAAAARAEAAAASLRAVERRVAELQVVAGVAGTVEALEVRKGDLVSTQAPVLSIMDTENLWVRAYVPENRLDLRLGDRVGVSVDSFPGRRFAGRVSFIAREAEFTPGNVQTPEERSKQVFRIKVTLEEGLDVLRPGMAADVHLDDPERG